MIDDYTVLQKNDPSYPELLRQIHSAPKTLYVKGNMTALTEPQIAIVGCRQMSPYGAEQAFAFAKALAGIGLAVTSGLAVGIDTMAHQGALAGQGQTIAVLGTGVNKLYPPQNKNLAEEIIAKGGAIISEFPPDTEPFPYNFPRRNRIISALSIGVLVVEAAEKSGSLITARYALEQNREVFAIPGPINSVVSRGCNKLIAEGAILVESLADLLIHIKDKLTTCCLQTQKKHDNPIKRKSHPLFEFFSREPIPLDLLLVKTGTSLERLNAELLMLELSGDIELVAGGYILKKGLYE